MNRLAFIFLTAFVVCVSVVSAQTTRPGIFDNQPIRRSAVDASKESAVTSATIAEPAKREFLDFKQVGVALLVVLGLAFSLKWVVQKLTGIKPGRLNEVVRVLGRTPISPRQQVLVLQVGRRVIVAADSGGQISALSQITEPDEVAELIGKITSRATENSTVFNSVIDQAQKSFDEKEESFTDDADEPIAAPEIAKTQAEISGLMEKVRSLAGQYKK